jgi:hypothetical protein
MNLNFVCRFLSRNIGDAYCSPQLYYQFTGFHKTRIELKNLTKYQPDGVESYIIGGGLYNEKNLRLIRQYNHLIIWGAGIFDILERQNKVLFSGLKKCMVGARDFVDGYPYRWVPCASCKHRIFDEKHNPNHEFVVYQHHAKPLQSEARAFNLPVKSNRNDTLSNAVSFIGSGENLITNSYHGMYWGMLLGKKVYVVNELNSKTRTFKYQPTYCNSFEDAFSLPSNSYDGLLEECRYLNDRFYDDVLNVLSNGR